MQSMYFTSVKDRYFQKVSISLLFICGSVLTSFTQIYPNGPGMQWAKDQWLGMDVGTHQYDSGEDWYYDSKSGIGQRHCSIY